MTKTWTVPAGNVTIVPVVDGKNNAIGVEISLRVLTKDVKKLPDDLKQMSQDVLYAEVAMRDDDTKEKKKK